MSDEAQSKNQITCWDSSGRAWGKIWDASSVIDSQLNCFAL